MEDDKTIVIERVFNAPREKVWKAWTDTAEIEKWWGPRGFSTRVEKSDLKNGGSWRYVMVEEATGTEYPAEGVIKEIIDQERVVTTDNFDEKDVAANPNLPQGLVTTTVFTDLGDKTKLSITISHPTAEEKKKHEAMGVLTGWNESLDKLAENLSN